MNDMIVTDRLQLVELHGEPTVRDADLGVRLGMKRPTNIRGVIERNRKEIEGYGLVHAVSAPYESGKGRVETVTEYHLTEEQALCVCQLSRAPKAKDVRRALIEVFTAWRRGHLVPEVSNQSIGGVVKGILNKQLPAALTEALEVALPAMIEERLARDPRIGAVTHIPALQVAVDRQVPQKGRHRIVRMISNDLTRFCERRGEYEVHRDVRGVKLFDRAAVRHWVLEGGWDRIAKALVEAHGGQTNIFMIDGGKRKPDQPSA